MIQFLSKLINSIRADNIAPIFRNYGKTPQEIMIFLSFVLLTTVLLNTLKNTLEGWFIPYYLSFARRQMITKTIEKSGENFKELESGKFVAKILFFNMQNSILYFYFLKC